MYVYEQDHRIKSLLVCLKFKVIFILDNLFLNTNVQSDFGWIRAKDCKMLQTADVYRLFP